MTSGSTAESRYQMKLSVLETALRLYKESVDFGLECTNDDEERQYLDQIQTDLVNCQIELHEMKTAATAAGHDKDYCDDVTPIPSLLMTDLGNQLWYNDFGRMARRLPLGRKEAANFVSAIHNFPCPEISRLVLEDIHCFLLDLWSDNEAAGENNSDGTIAGYLKDADVEQIKYVLDAYLLCNEDVLEEDEIQRIKTAIKSFNDYIQHR